MKKYRVKIDMPFFEKGEILEYFNGYFRNKYASVEKPECYPDCFEEIKKLLFVTEDGVELFDKMANLVAVCLGDYYIEETYLEFVLELHHKRFKYFSSKAAAEKWIAENKPVFSKAHILSAIDGCLLMTSSNRISVSELKNILGLNNP